MSAGTRVPAYRACGCLLTRPTAQVSRGHPSTYGNRMRPLAPAERASSMTRSLLSTTLGPISLAVLLAVVGSAPAAPPDGVEVLTRGPVHEAFAEPVTGQPEPGPVVPGQPPEAVPELPPDQRPEG